MSGKKSEQPAYLIVNNMIVKAIKDVYNNKYGEPKKKRHEHVYALLVLYAERSPIVRERLENDPVNEDVIHQMARNCASAALERLKEKPYFDATVL